MTYRNHEGYKDPTAGRAIRNADRKARYRKVVYAHWIEPVKRSDRENLAMVCSNCHSVEIPLARHRYCPNCGARMYMED